MRTCYWRAGLALVLALLSSGMCAWAADPGGNDEVIQAALKAVKDSAVMPDSPGVKVMSQPFWTPRPAAAAVPAALSAAVIGYPQEGLPCFSCVNGISNSLGMPIPIAFLARGSSVSKVLVFQVAANPGPVACTAYALVMLNGKPASIGKVAIEGGCQPNYSYWVSFAGSLPSTAGSAALVGILSAGGVNSILQVPITIQ